MAKTPVFFTSLVATSASTSRTLAHWAFFSSVAVASVSASAPLLIAAAAFFIAFIGAMAISKAATETSSSESAILKLLQF